MTDNEIIKALECCGRESCNGCPYDKNCHQGNPMIRDALDLINRQQAEIERLSTFVKFQTQVKAEAIKEYKEKLIYEIVNTPTQKPQYKEALSYFDGTRNRQAQIIEIINGFEEKEMGNT